MRSRRTTALTLVTLACTCAQLLGATPAQPPPDKFVRIFAARDGGPVSLAPDGKHLAYMVREKGEAFLHLFSLADSKVVFRVSVGKDDENSWGRMVDPSDPVVVHELHWLNREDLVLATTGNQIIAVNARAKTSRFLVDLNDKRSGRIVGLLPRSPPHVVIEAVGYDFENGKASHLRVNVNVATGSFESTSENVEGRLAYDHQGNAHARYITGVVPTSPQVRRRAGGITTWIPLHQEYPEASRPVPFTPESCFGERSFPLFVDETHVYFASNVGRDTLGIYSIDRGTRQRTSLVVEDPDVDLALFRGGLGFDPLVRDRATQAVVGVRVTGGRVPTRWFDQELEKVQRTLDSRFRASSITLVDWDDARQLFLVKMNKRGEAATYHLYRPARDNLQFILSENSQLSSLPRVVTSAWSLPQSSGANLSGFLVVPAEASPVPRPVVIRFQTGFWMSADRYYDADVLALAQMGYAVLEVNHRGVGGFGRAHLRAGQHRFDEVAVEDVMKAIEGMPAAANLDVNRVAVIGRSYGGYLALRALQLQRGRFVCGVALEPITDLASWLSERSTGGFFRVEHGMREWFFGTDKTELRRRSPESDPKGVSVPVMLTGNPNRQYDQWSELKAFRRTLTSAGNPPTFLEVEHRANSPSAERAQMWGQIEAFLRAHLGSR